MIFDYYWLVVVVVVVVAGPFVNKYTLQPIGWITWRWTAQRKNVQNQADLIDDNVLDLESDPKAEQFETELQELREGIIAEVAEKHPIAGF